MSRKHKLIFVALSLFPFVLAMGFRTVDNYQFALKKQQQRKLHPDYYPAISNSEEKLQEQEYTCHELIMTQDSLHLNRKEID